MIRRKKIQLALALVLAISLIIRCLATEQVVKMTSHPDMGIGGANIVTLSNSFGPGSKDIAQANTFIVYTKSEVDGLVQPLSQDLSRDQQEISDLNAAIKTLSDANDALTKRLNDVEAKLNKQGQR